MPRTKFATAAAESSAGRSHPCRRTIDPRSPRTTTTTARSTPAHSLVGGIRRSPPPPRCPNSRSPIAVRDSSSSPGRRVRLGEAARNDDDERSPSPDDDRRALRASSGRSHRSSSSLGGGHRVTTARVSVSGGPPAGLRRDDRGRETPPCGSSRQGRIKLHLGCAEEIPRGRPGTSLSVAKARRTPLGLGHSVPRHRSVARVLRHSANSITRIAAEGPPVRGRGERTPRRKKPSTLPGAT